MRRAVTAWAAAGLVLLAGCVSNISIPGLSGKQTDEERIAAILDDAHRGMQTRNANRVISHISKDYMDPDGRNYDAICVFVRHVIDAYRDIEITRVEPRIEVDGDTARALEAFGTLASPADADSTAPVNLQGQVLVTLQKEEGTWKIISWGTLH